MQRFGHVGEAIAHAVLYNPSTAVGDMAQYMEIAAGYDLPAMPSDREIGEGAELACLVHEAAQQTPPKVNVFQAALALHATFGVVWLSHFRPGMVFRGERRADWSERCFTPSILRGSPTGEELRQRRRELDVASAWFRRRFPEREDTPEEILAILQHYGRGTWLLDATTSAYVALSFASHEGEEGEGVVYAFSMSELGRMHRIFPRLAPRVRQVQPQFVPRIQRQYATFLVGGVGQFTSDLVRGRLTFLQRPGFVFEDPGIGVTESGLYQRYDEWQPLESSLPGYIESWRSPAREVPSGLGRLVDEAMAELRAEANAAPILDVGDVPSPAFPPPVEFLREAAAAILKPPEGDVGQRHWRAAEFVAEFFYRVLAMEPYDPYAQSFHSFEKLLDKLRSAMSGATEVSSFVLVEHCLLYTRREDGSAFVAILRDVEHRLGCARL